MREQLLIALGGAIGALLRVALSRALPPTLLAIPFPTLFVNVLGCFVMGVLVGEVGFYWPTSANMRGFWVSGLLGGFTTFSTFSLDFGLLFLENRYILSLIYLLFSVSLSIACFFLGVRVARLV